MQDLSNITLPTVTANSNNTTSVNFMTGQPYEGILADYTNLYNAAQQDVANYGATEQTQLSQSYAQQYASAQQGLQSMGLGNTTIGSSVNTGIGQAQNIAQQNLAEQIGAYKTDSVQAAGQARAAFEANVYGAQIGVLGQATLQSNQQAANLTLQSQEIQAQEFMQGQQINAAANLQQQQLAASAASQQNQFNYATALATQQYGYNSNLQAQQLGLQNQYQQQLLRLQNHLNQNTVSGNLYNEQIANIIGQ